MKQREEIMREGGRTSLEEGLKFLNSSEQGNIVDTLNVSIVIVDASEDNPVPDCPLCQHLVLPVPVSTASASGPLLFTS